MIPNLAQIQWHVDPRRDGLLLQESISLHKQTHYRGTSVSTFLFHTQTAQSYFIVFVLSRFELEQGASSRRKKQCFLAWFSDEICIYHRFAGELPKNCRSYHELWSEGKVFCDQLLPGDACGYGCAEVGLVKAIRSKPIFNIIFSRSSSWTDKPKAEGCRGISAPVALPSGRKGVMY